MSEDIRQNTTDEVESLRTDLAKAKTRANISIGLALVAITSSLMISGPQGPAGPRGPAGPSGPAGLPGNELICYDVPVVGNIFTWTDSVKGVDDWYSTDVMTSLTTTTAMVSRCE